MTLQHDTQQGFTLVEVMVALFIVALALPALMNQVGTQVENTGHLRDRAVASWVADNALARLLAEERLTGESLEGESRGQSRMAGREWSWRIVTEQTPVPLLWRYTASAGSAEDALISTLEVYRQRARPDRQGRGE